MLDAPVSSWLFAFVALTVLHVDFAYGWEPVAAQLEARLEEAAKRRQADPKWILSAKGPRPQWADRAIWFEGKGEDRYVLAVVRVPREEFKYRPVDTARGKLNEAMNPWLQAEAARANKAAGTSFQRKGRPIAPWPEVFDAYVDPNTNQIAILGGAACAVPPADYLLNPCDDRKQIRSDWGDVIDAHPTRPKWADRGAWFEGEGKARRAFAVGLASDIKNSRLMQSTAANRARAKLGGLVLGVKVERRVEGRSVSVRTFSSSTLIGVEVVDYYYDVPDYTLYSLVSVACGGPSFPCAESAARPSSKK